MESPKRITKSQLVEMVRKEIDFQEKKKFLENRIAELNEEIYIISEGESGKKRKKDKEIEEGLFQNMGRAIKKGVSGLANVGQGIKQNYQKGVDQKSLEYITNDIKTKEAELAQLKKDFQFKTGENYSAKNSQNPTAVARNKQGVVKAPAKKQTVKTAPVAQPVQAAKPVTKAAPKKQAVKPAQPVAKAAPKKQTTKVIPPKTAQGQNRKVAQ